MKKLTRNSLDELAQRIPVLNEELKRSFIGGSSVKVSVNRSFYGDNSTMSYFQATVYDDNGAVIGCMSGMFLEPGADYDKCTSAGSDTAIQYGTYNIVPSTYHGNSGYYEISGVEGRSGIKIHAGNTGCDTLGCFLPGTSGAYNSGTGESSVSGSRDKLTELTNFFNRYGDGGIKMEVTI